MTPVGTVKSAPAQSSVILGDFNGLMCVVKCTNKIYSNPIKIIASPGFGVPLTARPLVQHKCFVVRALFALRIYVTTRIARFEVLCAAQNQREDIVITCDTKVDADPEHQE